MKLKIALMSISLASLLIQSTYAQTGPTECPTPSAIISYGLFDIKFSAKDNSYAAYQISDYQTKFTWGFGIEVPGYQAHSEQEALAIAKAALPSLKANFTKPIEKNGKYLCIYNANGLQAAAVTPTKIIPLV